MQVWPPNANVLGTPISRTSFEDCVRAVERRQGDRAIVVNVCNVHSVMSARQDPSLAEALAAGHINTPDGMPLVWFLRSLGFSGQRRVAGTELAEFTFTYGVTRGWRHYFYGSTEETLHLLVANLERVYPGIQIAGIMSPPFRALDAGERDASLQAIRDAKPDIVWVGLGMPKQEKWMHDVRDELPNTVLFGIGAAFEFFANTKPRAPQWLQNAGLEWLFRLASEPRRLWRRYIWNNPAFLALWLNEMANRRDRRS